MFTSFIRGATGKCPHCGVGAMANGLFATHDKCSHCGLVYQNAPGDFTGASVLSYGVTSLITLTFGLLAVIFTEWSLLAIMVIGIALVIIVGVATYQPLKGLWIAFLVETESLTPPDRP